MYYINENLQRLDRIFDQNLREGYLRMDLNENPGGLPEEFVQKVLSEITPEFISQYPETLPFTQSLANLIGAEINNICLVNGSAEGVRFVIEAFTSPGGVIVGVEPSYAMYSVFADMYGREFKGIHYHDDLSLDVEDILSAMTEDVELLVILNPNNPIGNVYTDSEMDQIVAKAKQLEITILIDEAYYYFYPHSFIKYALENEHIYLTRTFSKLFSLAGARLGYVVGDPAGIALIQKLCTPHNVNGFAMRFAQTIMETDGMIEELVAKQLDGKAFLVNELRGKGYMVNDGEGNFIFVKPKTDADEIVKKLKEEKHILVKTYKGIGEMGNCLRVSTGEKRLMQVFIDALAEVDV